MSMGHRALRLSTLMAPKPPPVGVLPPRPDEVAPAPPSQQQSDHRRNGSASSRRDSAILGRVRASTSENGTGSPYMVPSSPSFPPPRGPLPAPPVAAPTPVRHASLKLKQRLRILSAPPAPHPAAQPQPQQYSSQHSTPTPRSRPTSLDATSPPPRPARSRARPGPMTLATFLSASTPSTPTTAAPVPLSPTAFYAGTPPATPIGEKIIEFRTQNDPSFLELSTGSTPVIPSRALPALSGPGTGVDPPAPENEYAEIVSLPPPRRSSRQISIKDVERAPTPPPDPAAIPLPPDAEDEGGPAKLFSLSRNGSAVSLGIVTM
ncbi:hypothetical protein DFH08DRAFT_835277 [Mycena albidolilacea]|uniref:Uncharacterized protein n=1 Tax=Mycena albidolilacea TaxID=1033008 RepID=A0AAD7F5J6_9AGAR|nr:hypothetical protein DFH08DRAFT_835277 [Mycena albidolilacea]